MSYRIEHDLNDGIERISYYPDNPRFETPIVFQHGAWHGAWCWRWWQELFAEWGWISHAHSLSGHGNSRRKRPMRLNTFQSYRETLRQEVERCEKPPVVIGHSMGGMITQWYLRGVGDLPAVVLLASMPLHDYPPRYLMLDPTGLLLATLTFSGTPLIRTAKHVERLFISEGALMSGEQIKRKLNSESLFVTLQLSHLTWHPRRNPDTPVLVMAAENDIIFNVREERQMAEFYGGDFHLVEDTAHNIMMEKTYRESAKVLHDWFITKGIE
ncbi:MAG: alpha/beta hydrolase [Aggregatilineales bacterium]